MNKLSIFLTAISLFSFSLPVQANICGKNYRLSIKMPEEWYRKEKLRLENEEILLQKYEKFITKKIKPLIAEPYNCKKGKICDPVKNCQMERNVKNFKDVEYQMTTDSGIVIAKSYCSVIGKCIGYNDFIHNSKVTAAEDRLIDIRKDNAIFYHYFYAVAGNNYEPLFNITNLHTGSEIYLDDMPHFSPDERFFVEVRSVNNPVSSDAAFPVGYNINIYELGENGEYKNMEPAETDPENPKKVLSTFLSRNSECGPTPHFHSWKSNTEVRLSMLPPKRANEGKKVILSYDEQSKKWSCQEDIFPESECNSYLPTSNEFSSNIAPEQIENCQ